MTQQLRGNRELIAQAITNLLDNALKYGLTKSKSKIQLSLETDNKNAEISVSDNGEGIPLVERENVLKRFVRLDASRNKPGSGLGLSLVEAVVRLHGGELELDDANPGLMVKISLPLA